MVFTTLWSACFWKVSATRDPGAIDCNCFASSAPMENFRSSVVATCCPAEFVVVVGTLITTESP